MNIFKLIEDIKQVDAEALDRLEFASRRSFMSSLGTKLMAAATPVALASVFNKAFAFTPGAIEVLKFALTLEYLEDEFYKAGNAKAGLIPDMYKPVFAQIGKHESQHVAFLESALGAAAPAKPNFDFTAKGTLPDSLNTFDGFVFLSHAFEDTGVRAYKGQAGNLMAAEDKPLLEYALQIHSVEARHAAVARKILGTIRNRPEIKPWITLNEGSPAAVYAGEDNTVQGGVDINGIAGKSKEAVTEAFDEILTKEAVFAIVTPFLA
ncbi:hypothetical protein GCM10027275_32050 [Rhabdobacter roseus]|uniref:Ferritin-like domain-containing protein n=1 Tax=Rhabdobacter roseus TaxID=1655419 RepID=A0A840TP82_9BACT|nr:ferritin-like domain-containing protein [Rhabdobacter roseus]MBB5285164.1 hypothetical protein [Rhabdobacter roseus]